MSASLDEANLRRALALSVEEADRRAINEAELQLALQASAADAEQTRNTQYLVIQNRKSEKADPSGGGLSQSGVQHIRDALREDGTDYLFPGGNRRSWLAASGKSLLLQANNVPHVVQPILGDGNCYFRAIEMALYQTESSGYMHIKRQIADMMTREDFESYIIDYTHSMGGRPPDGHDNFARWKAEWPSRSGEWATGAMINYSMKYVKELQDIAVYIIADGGQHHPGGEHYPPRITCLTPDQLRGKNKAILLRQRMFSGKGTHYELIRLAMPKIGAMRPTPSVVRADQVPVILKDLILAECSGNFIR